MWDASYGGRLSLIGFIFGLLLLAIVSVRNPCFTQKSSPLTPTVPYECTTRKKETWTSKYTRTSRFRRRWGHADVRPTASRRRPPTSSSSPPASRRPRALASSVVGRRATLPGTVMVYSTVHMSLLKIDPEDFVSRINFGTLPPQLIWSEDFIDTRISTKLPPPPNRLLLGSAPNLGPSISCWKIDKFENCWYKSVRI